MKLNKFNGTCEQGFLCLETQISLTLSEYELQDELPLQYSILSCKLIKIVLSEITKYCIWLRIF